MSTSLMRRLSLRASAITSGRGGPGAPPSMTRRPERGFIPILGSRPSRCPPPNCGSGGRFLQPRLSLVAWGTGLPAAGGDSFSMTRPLDPRNKPCHTVVHDSPKQIAKRSEPISGCCRAAVHRGKSTFCYFGISLANWAERRTEGRQGAGRETVGISETANRKESRESPLEKESKVVSHLYQKGKSTIILLGSCLLAIYLPPVTSPRLRTADVDYLVTAKKFIVALPEVRLDAKAAEYQMVAEVRRKDNSGENIALSIMACVTKPVSGLPKAHPRCLLLWRGHRIRCLDRSVTHGRPGTAGGVVRGWHEHRWNEVEGDVYIVKANPEPKKTDLRSIFRWGLDKWNIEVSQEQLEVTP